MQLAKIVCQKDCGFAIWDSPDNVGCYDHCEMCGAAVRVTYDLPKKRTPFFVTRRGCFQCVSCGFKPSKEDRNTRKCPQCCYRGSSYVYTMEDLCCCPNCGAWPPPPDPREGVFMEKCPQCGFEIPSEVETDNEVCFLNRGFNPE